MATKPNIYVDGRPNTAWVFGDLFGPKLLFVGDNAQAALSEWDEQFGVRVDYDTDFSDYDGDTREEQIDNALSAGDMRYNDGGTLVVVDPHEWYRVFRGPDAVKIAGAYYRNFRVQ